jgi:hypothetical protein
LDVHAARKTLEHDLASFTSPSDLNDLHAILDRYSDEETAEIRRILALCRAPPEWPSLVAVFPRSKPSASIWLAVLCLVVVVEPFCADICSAEVVVEPLILGLSLASDR